MMGEEPLAPTRAPTKKLDLEARRVLRHYQKIAEDFDELFPDWRTVAIRDARILDQVLAPYKARTVLDCACGTGIQTIGLARLGYALTATDFSERMLARAKAKAAEEGLAVTFARSDFRELQEKVRGPFDAVICCGNSLTHLRRESDFLLALANMYGVLRPYGVAVVEIRNYDKLKEQGRFFELRRAQRVGDQFVIVFDVREFRNDSVDVTSVFLRARRSRWNIKRYRVRYTCLTEASLLSYMVDVGFPPASSVDGLTGGPVSRESDWVMVVGVKGETAPELQMTNERARQVMRGRQAG